MRITVIDIIDDENVDSVPSLSNARLCLARSLKILASLKKERKKKTQNSSVSKSLYFFNFVEKGKSSHLHQVSSLLYSEVFLIFPFEAEHFPFKFRIKFRFNKTNAWVDKIYHTPPLCTKMKSTMEQKSIWISHFTALVIFLPLLQNTFSQLTHRIVNYLSKVFSLWFSSTLRAVCWKLTQLTFFFFRIFFPLNSSFECESKRFSHLTLHLCRLVDTDCLHYVIVIMKLCVSYHSSGAPSFFIAYEHRTSVGWHR